MTKEMLISMEQTRPWPGPEAGWTSSRMQPYVDCYTLN